jgi:hypothetical protein
MLPISPLQRTELVTHDIMTHTHAQSAYDLLPLAFQFAAHSLRPKSHAYYIILRHADPLPNRRQYNNRCGHVVSRQLAGLRWRHSNPPLNTSTVSLRVVGGDEREPSTWWYNCATLSLGDINTETWSSRLGESPIWDSKIWNSDPRMTALARFSNCKRQTRPLVIGGAPHQQTRNCLTAKKKKNWSCAPDGGLTPRQTGRLIVGRNITLTLSCWWSSWQLQLWEVRSWYLRPGTVREPRGRGTSAVEAATKQRLVTTEKTLCVLQLQWSLECVT